LTECISCPIMLEQNFENRQKEQEHERPEQCAGA